jgi:archaellum biogenesis ATPase FlaH
MTFADGNKMGLPLLPLNQVRAPPMMGPPPPPMNGTMSNQQQKPPQGGPQGQPPFTYINNGTHVMFKQHNGQIDYYKLNSAISRAVTETDINNFLNLLSSMGQLNQQLVNFISTSSLDEATKQQLLQLAQLFFKDPVNFWANNWSTVLSVVSKLPQSFLTQIQSLLFPSAGTKVATLDINNFLNLLSSMGQLNQQLVNFISTSSLDEATKQQLLQLAQLFFKDPVNFWANNWSTVLSVVSKLPQSFLTQIQSLLFPPTQ